MLFVAGARSVVLTLMPVPDAPAARLMALFYTHLAAGRNPADALTLAKRDVRARGAGAVPSTWAAFGLVGAG